MKCCHLIGKGNLQKFLEILPTCKKNKRPGATYKQNQNELQMNYLNVNNKILGGNIYLTGNSARKNYPQNANRKKYAN